MLTRKLNEMIVASAHIAYFVVEHGSAGSLRRENHIIGEHLRMQRSVNTFNQDALRVSMRIHQLFCSHKKRHVGAFAKLIDGACDQVLSEGFLHKLHAACWIQRKETILEYGIGFTGCSRGVVI